MWDFIIILPTHSSYIEITKSFIQLLKKNWANCPFKIVVSTTGKKVVVDGAENLYNGKKASLIDCVVNVTKKYKSKYYISFLGDAFINNKINNEKVLLLLDDLLINQIDYCSLKCVRNYKKRKNFDDHFRHINNLDRYSHNFTAFVASYDYINDELSKYKTDLDFEKAYLFQTENFYFDKHLIVKKNYLNLLPCITKGKWDNINYRRLTKKNPEINFEERELQSLKESLVCHVRNKVVSNIPDFVRRKIKAYTEKVFNMRFGVEG